MGWPAGRSEQGSAHGLESLRERVAPLLCEMVQTDEGQADDELGRQRTLQVASKRTFASLLQPDLEFLTAASLGAAWAPPASQGQVAAGVTGRSQSTVCSLRRSVGGLEARQQACVSSDPAQGDCPWSAGPQRGSEGGERRVEERGGGGLGGAPCPAAWRRRRMVEPVVVPRGLASPRWDCGTSRELTAD